MLPKINSVFCDCEWGFHYVCDWHAACFCWLRKTFFFSLPRQDIIPAHLVFRTKLATLHSAVLAQCVLSFSKLFFWASLLNGGEARFFAPARLAAALPSHRADSSCRHDVLTRCPILLQGRACPPTGPTVSALSGVFVPFSGAIWWFAGSPKFLAEFLSPSLGMSVSVTDTLSHLVHAGVRDVAQTGSTERGSYARPRITGTHSTAHSSCARRTFAHRASQCPLTRQPRGRPDIAQPNAG